MGWLLWWFKTGLNWLLQQFPIDCAMFALHTIMLKFCNLRQRKVRLFAWTLHLKIYRIFFLGWICWQSFLCFLTLARFMRQSRQELECACACFDNLRDFCIYPAQKPALRVRVHVKVDLKWCGGCNGGGAIIKTCCHYKCGPCQAMRHPQSTIRHPPSPWCCTHFK